MKTDDLNYREACLAYGQGGEIEDSLGYRYKKATVDLMSVNTGKDWCESKFGFQEKQAPFRIVQPEKAYLTDVKDIFNGVVKVGFELPNGLSAWVFECKRDIPCRWDLDTLARINTALACGVKVEIIERVGE